MDEVLELVHLRDRAKEPVRTLSNGMKQRVMIARAWLHKPPVLFLDEPSRGLDPISAREVRQAIDHLRQAGMTILLTTHLMEEADLLCQRVGFIVNGRLVASDTPRNLKLSHGQRVLGGKGEKDAAYAHGLASLLCRCGAGQIAGRCGLSTATLAGGHGYRGRLYGAGAAGAVLCAMRRVFQSVAGPAPGQHFPVIKCCWGG